MGLFKAGLGAFGGALADQWKDFYTIPDGLSPTAALFSAVLAGSNSGRGSNVSGSTDVITNGSKIVVPEGYGLILMQDGAITGFAAEPGGYEWNSEAQDSRSIFAGDGIASALIHTSWERFKFGGRPQAQQRAYFVALKELPNNKFGTPSEIYWDDAYLNTQVGAMARGTYTLKIADPILFVKQYLPAKYLQHGAVFDFTDLKNDAAEQLFSEIIGSLASALSLYTNDPAQGNRITRIQQDAIGFALSLSAAVERSYSWRSERGLEIVRTAIVSIEYDEGSHDLLNTVRRADALSGARGNSNLQASVASGIQSAGHEGGTAGLIGMGIATGTLGVNGLQQPATPTPAAPTSQEDPMAKLLLSKQMLDAGLITQPDYDAIKAKVLGL